ncbi:hypothetical protein LINPERHAP1_LOCUS13727 [Linum perenne]
MNVLQESINIFTMIFRSSLEVHPHNQRPNSQITIRLSFTLTMFVT